MSRRPASVLLVVTLLGCSSAPPEGRAPAHASTAPGTQAAAPAASAGVAPSAGGASMTVASAANASTPDAGADTSPPAAPPPVDRAGKVWPFHPWDRAEAVTFNRFAMRPGVPLHAYDERGWSPHLAERKRLASAQAKSAVDLVTETRGDVLISACPFPRHAVVLFDGDVPVASINVCFSCGDILLWPRWSIEPASEKLTKRGRAELELQRKKQLALYDKVFPQWTSFFRDDVGLAIDEPPRDEPH